MPFLNLKEIKDAAQKKLPKPNFDYIDGAAGDESALKANEKDYRALAIVPRAMQPVQTINTWVQLFGLEFTSPIMIGPTAFHGLADPENKELATAQAAKQSNTAMVVSTMANTSIEEIAQVSGSNPLFFQLYLYKNRAISEALIRRAETAGYKGIVLTVDVTYMGRRERDINNNFQLPDGLVAANFVSANLEKVASASSGSQVINYTNREFETVLDWNVVKWLKSITQLPIIVKGILHPDDATLAVAAGVDGIIVSNHGGRQVGGAISTIRALPGVVHAVAGRCPVLVDGGMRSGEDIFKALALGAKAVLIGRPILWGLAADGAQGVQAVLKILQEQLELTMRLACCPNLTFITADLVIDNTLPIKNNSALELQNLHHQVKNLTQLVTQLIKTLEQPKTVVEEKNATTPTFF
ncbi:MAG: alpha-hydroxy acid oxidase [Gammaproteobacteria bacterium]